METPQEDTSVDECSRYTKMLYSSATYVSDMTLRRRKTEQCSRYGDLWDSLSHSVWLVCCSSSRKSQMISFPASSYICWKFLNCYMRLICVKSQTCFNVTAWCAICSINPGRQQRRSHFNDLCKQVSKCQMLNEAYKHNIDAKLSIFEMRVLTGL